MENVILYLNKVAEGFWSFSGSMLIQSSILILLLLVIDRLIRKRVRAVFRYCIWMLVFVKLLLPPSLCLPTGVGYWCGLDRWPVNQQVSPKTPVKITAQQADAIAAQYGLDHLPPAPKVSGQPVRTQVPMMTADGTYMPPIEPGELESPSVHAAIPAPPAVTLSWKAFALFSWLVGVLVLSVLLIQRFWFVKSLIAQSEPADGQVLDTLNQCRRQVGLNHSIELRLTANMLSPAACGLLNPVILIPASLLEKLTDEKLKTVLIHELAHIKRGDLWMNFLQTVLQIVYFYNPLLWIANAVVRGIREKAVDEMVLTKLGDQADTYSNTLIDIAEIAFSRPHFCLRLVGVVESKKALTDRIKHILSRPFPKSAKIGLMGLAAIFITAAVLLPMAKGEKSDINDEIHKTRPLTNKEKIKIKNKWISVIASPVNGNGKYLYPDEGITLKEFLGAADYKKDKMNEAYIEVVRQIHPKDDAYKVYSRNLEALFNGKETDIALQPRDAVVGGYVGVSPNAEEFWRPYRFTDVIELTINDDGAKADMFADLDTGQLLTPPMALNAKNEKALMKWVEENGIDVMGETADVVHGLVSFHMNSVLQVDDSLWDADKVEIADRLYAKMTDRWKVLGVENKVPTTYLIETSEYKIGVLQILGVTENPKAVKIRYKLLEKQNSELPTNNYTATLPNGVTVELLGVCEYPSEGKQWSSPDGSLVDRPYKKLNTTYVESDYKLHELLFRVTGQHEMFTQVELNDSIKGHFGISLLNKKADGIEPTYLDNCYSVVVSCEQEANTCDVEIGLWIEDWETKAASKGNEVHMFGSKAYSFSEAITLPDGTIKISLAHDPPEGKNDQRMIAVDQQGNIHKSIRERRAGTAQIEQYQVKFKDTDLDEIKEFRFQTCPFNWTTFKNISLRPGGKTQVEVSVDDGQSTNDEAAEASTGSAAIKQTLIGNWSGTAIDKPDEGSSLDTIEIQFVVNSQGQWAAVATGGFIKGNKQIVENLQIESDKVEFDILHRTGARKKIQLVLNENQLIGEGIAIDTQEDSCFIVLKKKENVALRPGGEREAPSKVDKQKVYLPDLESKDAKTVLDLASGQMLSAEGMGKDRRYFEKLGKGDLVYEYAQNKSGLLCLRGAAMQIRSDSGLQPTTPEVQRTAFDVYFLKQIPCQYQVTTAEGHKYEIKILSIKEGDDGGAEVEFWKSEDTGDKMEGEESSNNKQIQIPVVEAKNYVAEVPGIGKVELVSVCPPHPQQSREDRIGWRPDGGPLSQKLFTVNFMTPMENTKPISFVLKMDSDIEIREAQSPQFAEGERSWSSRNRSYAFNEKGRHITSDKNSCYETFAGLFRQESTVVDLNLRIQRDQWSTQAVYDGKYIIGHADERVRFVESYDGAGGAKVAFNHTFEGMDVSAQVAYLPSPKEGKQQREQIKTGYVSTAEDSEGNPLHIAFFSDVSLSMIREIRIRTRPQEYTWVQFKNVALHPIIDLNRSNEPKVEDKTGSFRLSWDQRSATPIGYNFKTQRHITRRNPHFRDLLREGMNLFLTNEPISEQEGAPKLAKVHALNIAVSQSRLPVPETTPLDDISDHEIINALRHAVLPLDQSQVVSSYSAPCTMAFRNRDGIPGVFRIKWDSESSCQVQYRLMPELKIREQHYPWGSKKDGLCCRLRMYHLGGPADTGLKLSLDLQNESDQAYSFVSLPAAHCEIEVDGQWYGYAKTLAINHPVNTLQTKHIHFDGLMIGLNELNGSWALPAEGKSLRHLPGVKEAWGERLKLTPGRHTIRIKFRPQEWMGKYIKGETEYYILSNPLIVEIPSSF